MMKSKFNKIKFKEWLSNNNWFDESLINYDNVYNFAITKHGYAEVIGIGFTLTVPYDCLDVYQKKCEYIDEIKRMVEISSMELCRNCDVCKPEINDCKFHKIISGMANIFGIEII